MSVALMVLAYLLGCVNGAYYIGKAIAKEDIRTLGSTNAGARNAGRVYGKKVFVMTVAADALKTVLPIGLLLIYEDASSLVPYWAGLCVLAGHIWPVQLQFRGGKGIVVYLAAVLVLEPVALLPVAIITLPGLLFKRFFTAAGLIAITTIPFTVSFLSSLWQGGTFLMMLIIVIGAHLKE